METEVIKDIKEYKSTYFGGLTGKQIICIFISAMLTGVIAYIIDIIGYFDLEVLKYILPVSLVPVAVGFLEVNNKSITEIIKLYFKFKSNREYIYIKQNTFIFEKEKNNSKKRVWKNAKRKGN